MNPYQWIWRYARRYKGKMWLAAILIIGNSLGIIVVPLLGGAIIDQVINQGHTERLPWMLAVMIGTTLVRTLMRYTYQILCERVGQNTLYDVRKDLFNKLQSLDFNFFNTVRTGDIMARMTGDMDAIRHFVSWVSYQVIECVLWFFTAVVVMSTISWPLMLALVAVTPLIGILTIKMSQAAHPVFFQIRQSFSRLNSMVEENISGNRVVKAFTQEPYEIQKFDKLNDDYKQRNMASAAVSRRYLPVLDFLASILTVIALLLGGYFVITKQMTLGDLVAFNGFLWMLNQPMRMSGWLINDMQRFSAATIKIRQMLGAKSQIPVNNADHYEKIHGTVEFRHVNFEYADDPTQPVLHDINFQVAPGQTMGILGETGSGKSTLMNLITRFYDPTSGEVLIDGKNAKDYPVRQLRDQVTIVMQDQFLFSDTIKDNINYGNRQADPGFIHAMADVADAEDFITDMPAGYDTVVGERGVGLSGGQKQRISLTRALVKDPAILILDDTTSALDMETEAKIQKELRRITADKTTFIIATRISSIRQADQIIVLQHGRIIERGTHDELLAKHGYYFDTYQKQLGALGVAPGEE
ncbi:ABC transporter ATP-binding protein [Schleiferilactobacillus perolens]|jgi:ATP-binding cassette subfamily B protein|uniref:Abc transporter, atp-binding and permease protein n=1 Tax=Schleiferilactobacillus perolens DSM 12744 TaxID=1423792 RepID=A0A0R1N0P0_9LACO|nr:ABC transporter ATP-binding protein [Schleiferilactobacillus perolens]KRL13840.1 abc transporter, atp-binding and permease protein [Schleiferilactobacillus perolens DSM 12744]MCI1891853.1 ABC transporter ATP-binding protein/permease [Schleiferilactobacillus harbinensis]MCI1911642.1 ABC transporter ATP-binding protein/permease [Schleiferilactobacillus harbinensis]MCI2171824.1 ABC transporter ATP-binding protein/permease [Schleiferilactobacillus perolens]